MLRFIKRLYLSSTSDRAPVQLGEGINELSGSPQERSDKPKMGLSVSSPPSAGIHAAVCRGCWSIDKPTR